MERITSFSKVLIAAILGGSSITAAHTYGGAAAPPTVAAAPTLPTPALATSSSAPVPSAVASAGPVGAPAYSPPVGRPIKVALSQWPGHMPLVVAAGGLRTAPGSIAATHGLDVEISFIEDAPSKNKALATGEVDFVWQTVDELPISLGTYKAANVEVRAFLQIDWSRGGDACVASKEVRTVEDIVGKKSGVLMFSPDHTVFEFMITNSRLTAEQVKDARKATRFSMDDFAYARRLFAAGEIDVACLWEPDVTLALASRPGAHRLFSTADATELVADVLLTRKALLDEHGDVAEKLVKVWFDAVERAEQDRPAAARLIATAASRFKDELGYEQTLAALGWAKWTRLPDNVRFFGVDGSPPAFDRVYNQADGIWINYPEAEIKDRFAPSVLRDSRAVETHWVAAGKPAPAVSETFQAAVAKAGVAVFTKPITVSFGSGSDVLGAEALSVLNREVLPQLQIAGGMYARVEGNTDGVGDRLANQALSERRAQAIVAYLVTRGVSPSRLVGRGNGAASPVATNQTPEGRALNRRTDVLFIRNPSSKL